jgi:hypothetical protein
MSITRSQALALEHFPLGALPNWGIEPTRRSARLMPGAHYDTFLESLNGPMGFPRREACMEALLALPARWDARLAVPRAGDAAPPTDTIPAYSLPDRPQSPRAWPGSAAGPQRPAESHAATGHALARPWVCGGAPALLAAPAAATPAAPKPLGSCAQGYRPRWDGVETPHGL